MPASVRFLFVALLFTGASVAAEPTSVRTLEWTDLIPENARAEFSSAPAAASHGYLGEGGPAAVQQSPNAPVNTELDGKVVKIPGFIVPLEVARDGTVSEFFLVPYFGDDIQVAPPPSNQMVYVRRASGIEADAVHEAYCVTGKMRLETKTTPLGTSAYSLVAEQVEQYQY